MRPSESRFISILTFLSVKKVSPDTRQDRPYKHRLPESGSLYDKAPSSDPDLQMVVQAGLDSNRLNRPKRPACK
jgi:hypothetical protein